MDVRVYKEKEMTKTKQTKLIHVGGYIAEVDVFLLRNEDEWSPYLSPADAMKLDEVKKALKEGNMAKASKKARVFMLTPVAV
jgi:hypothetical protein